MAKNAALKLSGGHSMPLLGLGCWQSQPVEVSGAVKAAILAGYRHIDTAYNYQNEQAVGEGIQAALREGKLDRKDLFVVTKLPLTGMRPERVQKYLKLSLSALGLDYVDLYLVHAPVGCQERGDELFPMEDGKLLLDPSTDHIALWHEMERMVELGLTREIGLSNFSSKQMWKIISSARKIRPSVHQVELHVLFQQREMQRFCRQHGVVLTSYGPLGSPGRRALMEQRGVTAALPDLLNNPIVRLVANKHGRTTAQILLRFLVQSDIIVIPKSVTESRILENGDIFSFQLDTLDMEALQYLDQGEEGRSFRFTTIFPGYSEHPEASM